MYNEDGFDAELAETLSLICHDECGGCPHDIGIQLAIAVRKHSEIVPYLEDLDEFQG